MPSALPKLIKGNPQQQSFCCVIFHLQGCNIIDVFDALPDRVKDIPTRLLTAHATTEVMRLLKAEGFEHIVLKHARFHELTQVISRVLSK